MNTNRELDIIGIQLDMGASSSGVAMGPLAIRYGGIINGLKDLGYTVNDKGDILPPATGASRKNMRHYEQIIAADQFDYTIKSTQNQCFRKFSTN